MRSSGCSSRMVVPRVGIGSSGRMRWSAFGGSGSCKISVCPLSEIQGIVREWELAPSAPGAMQLMRTTYQARLSETRAQIARLRALEAELAASLHYLHTCDSCDPARLVHACVACDQHACDHQAPELVAGFHVGTTSKEPRSTTEQDVPR